ncbi:hypothetical protein Pmani_039628 [Petrolisthes manimaculis]|uniref:Uncharacterized protein n=1 Tax=Petrolisthes manimaculis TaxID=1843537 RepID=A0AAE1TJ48_9EUCA|nr:hypothetical protein Pmani_039628 [Petrolisthes manimaculis]
MVEEEVKEEEVKEEEVKEEEVKKEGVKEEEVKEEEEEEEEEGVVVGAEPSETSAYKCGQGWGGQDVADSQD